MREANLPLIDPKNGAPPMFAAVYDLVLNEMEDGGLSQWRDTLLSPLSGRVLEIGAGTGLNLSHYTSEVTELVLVEPDHQMRKGLTPRAKACKARQLRLHAGTLEDYPHEPGSFDAVVFTLVLCTVPDPGATLRRAYHALAPGGTLVFIEHVAAHPETSRYVWQHRLEPVWKLCAGNCHLTRETEEEILAAGFEIQEIERESMRKALPFLRPSIRGIATKPA